jgi:hypothetical protein
MMSGDEDSKALGLRSQCQRSLTSELTTTIVVIMSGFEDCKALGRHSLCLTSDVGAKF